MMEINERGTGRTTASMMSARDGAIFIWCNDRLDYTKRLAKKIGRDDLKIVAPSWICGGWYGLRFPEIVIDHATYFRPDQLPMLEDALSRCEPNDRNPASK